MLGVSEQQELSVFERTLNRCMGMWSNGQTLYVSTLYQLWRFENALLPDQASNGYDRVFVPQVGYITGPNQKQLCPPAIARCAWGCCIIETAYALQA